MTITEETLRNVVNRIVEVAKPDRVILFGSAVTGEVTSDSDIDLLVLERSVENVREERIRLHEALRGLRIPVDVIVMSTERFEETKNVIGGIAYPANKYGKVIYEAA